ncbi:MAG: ABC transporter permease [Anaerolineae bacterium]
MIQASDVQQRRWNASLETFISMVKKQLIIMTRYPINFIVSFAMIFIIILMFAFATMMFSPSGVAAGGESGQAGGIMMFGFILFMFLSDTLWTIGYNVRWEQYEGTLESLYLTPASKFASLVSRVTISLVWTGLNVLAALLFVQYVLGRLPFHNLGLAAYILVMTLSGTFGFGFAFAAYTLLVKESAQMTANFLQFSLLVVCGMFFPFSVLPPVVGFISRLIPLSYAVDAFRSTLMGYPTGFPELLPIGQELIIVTGFGLLMPLAGYILYKAAEQKVRVDGSLAEF